MTLPPVSNVFQVAYSGAAFSQLLERLMVEHLDHDRSSKPSLFDGDLALVLNLFSLAGMLSRRIEALGFSFAAITPAKLRLQRLSLAPGKVPLLWED